LGQVRHRPSQSQRLKTSAPETAQLTVTTQLGKPRTKTTAVLKLALVQPRPPGQAKPKGGLPSARSLEGVPLPVTHRAPTHPTSTTGLMHRRPAQHRPQHDLLY
jgi:hypothetical protein